METKVQNREQWRNKREYFLAVAGNVVGFGNVWRFPYLCYKNGGGLTHVFLCMQVHFLLPYCFFAMLVGVPVFLLESAIGQYTQEGTITCWRKICPLGEGIGYAFIVIQLFARLYTIIIAWSLFYLGSAFNASLPWATCNNTWNTDRCVELTSPNWTSEHNANWTGNWTHETVTKSSVSEFWERRVLGMSAGLEEVGKVRWELVLCLLASWIGLYFCIWKGIRTTGKVVYFTALFPYVMLAILLVRGLTLPGAWQGLVFYLYPDPSRLLDLQVWMAACSQVLFSYGLAAGALTVMGSYNKTSNNIYKDSLWLCALNSGTSFVAGFAVFSALGFIAHQQGVPIDMVTESGPGLAFIAYPQAAAMMPLSQLWAVCFFIMLILLAVDTLSLCPTQNMNLILYLVAYFVLSCVFQGGIYQFQLIDYYGANGACLLFLCLAECVAVSWAFGADRMCDAIEEMVGQRPCLLFKLCWRYISPLICLVCFICSFLDYQPLTSKWGYVYPAWAYGLGWAMALSSIVVVPICGVCKVCVTEGSLRQVGTVILLHENQRQTETSIVSSKYLTDQPLVPMLLNH
uniref:Transporter n=1 Tax=Myripristis murdjan TaxID=586833 RepID=A0A668AW81_9TELE